MVYLTDEAEKPIASTGATGGAIVQQGGSTATIMLRPGAPSILQRRLVDPIARGARVLVRANLADGHAARARLVQK